MELQKCGFYLIFYDFDKDGVPLMRKIGDLFITLENKKGEDIEIRSKKIDEARKNLGHWKESKEIKKQNNSPVSVKKLTETLEAIFTVGVTRAEAAMLYQGVFRPKIKYPLGQTF